MVSSEPVTLDRARASDLPVLANLLELYIHDLCATFPEVSLGVDGRFGYGKLPLYFAEPERRFAYLVRVGGRLAGFALATRGSPAVDDPNVFDVAEFFVLRSYRHAGVGREAAFLLWRTLPGKWTVRVWVGHGGALAFWSRVVREFSGGLATETTMQGAAPASWRVFAFES